MLAKYKVKVKVKNKHVSEPPKYQKQTHKAVTKHSHKSHKKYIISNYCLRTNCKHITFNTDFSSFHYYFYVCLTTTIKKLNFFQVFCRCMIKTSH